MALLLRIPVSLVAARPIREVRILRGIDSGCQRAGVSHNRQAGLRNGLSWFTCGTVEFNLRRARPYGVQKRDGAFVLMRQGLHHVVSLLGGEGPRPGELFEAENDNADRCSNDLSWDSYLGEVPTCEKVEQPPEFVPPPPISVEDICMREKLECLLYTLERLLIGQLDEDKAEVLCSMLCATVEVQNPVFCFRGSDKCFEWLRALMQVQASINLHEIYYENDMGDSGKRRIYTVWTVSFLEHVRVNLGDFLENLSESEPNQMSGETMFEMEKSGLVSRISSIWYVLQEDGGASFTKAKDSLYHLLRRTL